MRDFFFQLVLFLAGVAIGIAVPLLPKTRQKLIAGLFSALLVGVSLVWAGYELRSIDLTKPTPLPTLTPTPTPHVNVLVLDEKGNPVDGANILLVAENGTYIAGKTDSDGKGTIAYSEKRMYTVFCAHGNFPAYLKHDFDPSSEFLLIQPRFRKG